MVSQYKVKPKAIKSQEFYLFLLILGIMVVIALAAPEFYSVNNVMAILNYFSLILIAAIGMNLIVLTGNIDVSAGAIISAVSVAMALLSLQGLPIGVFMPVGMLVGAALSFINAMLIIKLKIPSIVVTLATMQLFSGILPLLVDGAIYNLPPNFTWLAMKVRLFGFMSASILIMAVITVIALLFMKYSRFSKKLYAIGNNVHTAKLSGIDVNKTLVTSYVIAGALYGVAATILATGGERVTTSLGSGLEMTFIAAVVLGGTSIAGGRGKLLGTVFAAMILSLILPAMIYLGLPDDWSSAIRGGIILVTVLANQITVLTKKKRLMSVQDAGRS